MRDFMNIATLLVEYENLNHKAIAQYVYDCMDWSSGDGEQATSEYLRDMDLDDEDDNGHRVEVDIDAPEFMDWFGGWAENNYADAEWSIGEGLRRGGGKITLYRCITAPADWKPDPNRHPGVYWSWDKRAADAHWGEFHTGHIKWILETEATSDDIDWVTTLGQNGMPCYVEEKEVRLKDQPVTITAYYPKK